MRDNRKHMSQKKIRATKPEPKPIPLSATERARLAPYLAAAASAQQAYKSALGSASAITATIGERAGYPPEQKFQIAPDMATLIPIP